MLKVLFLMFFSTILSAKTWDYTFGGGFKNLEGNFYFLGIGITKPYPVLNLSYEFLILDGPYAGEETEFINKTGVGFSILGSKYFIDFMGLFMGLSYQNTVTQDFIKKESIKLTEKYFILGLDLGEFKEEPPLIQTPEGLKTKLLSKGLRLEFWLPLQNPYHSYALTMSLIFKVI